MPYFSEGCMQKWEDSPGFGISSRRIGFGTWIGCTGRWRSIFQSIRADGVFVLELLKIAAFPSDMKSLEKEGIRDVWRAEKLRECGYSRVGGILEYVEHSAGHRDGAETAKEVVGGACRRELTAGWKAGGNRNKILWEMPGDPACREHTRNIRNLWKHSLRDTGGNGRPKSFWRCRRALGTERVGACGVQLWQA